MEKLNVCLLNDSFPPLIDGVANAVVNYATVIQEKYGNAVVATPDYPGAEDNYPFEVCRYRSLDTTRLVGYRAGYPFSSRALTSIGEFKPDILHCHCPAMSQMFARTLRETLQVPLILTYHTKFDLDVARAVKTKMLQTTAIKAFANNISASDEVWVVSKGAGENLRTLGYEGDYRVMHNGVDFPKGRVSPEECLRLRKELGIGDETIFLFVGRMYWYKGVRLSFDGLARTKAAGYRFKMVLVGEGGDLEEMKNYAESVGIGGDCIFTGPVRDRQLLRSYFCMSDLFLFPSNFDTNGIVVREAAACSVPSVTLKGSCAAEDITDGETGIVIDETPEAMSAVTNWACEHREELRTLGQKALAGLYTSWEDAVGVAYERYQVVLDDFRSGRLVRKSVPFDDIFTVVSDFYSVSRKTSLKSSEIWNKLRRREPSSGASPDLPEGRVKKHRKSHGRWKKKAEKTKN